LIHVDLHHVDGGRQRDDGEAIGVPGQGVEGVVEDEGG